MQSFSSRVRTHGFGEYTARERMNPSILPPFTEIAELICRWGPPWLIRSSEWNGGTHLSSTGSGTHTVGLPSFMGMPSAPGNVPK